MALNDTWTKSSRSNNNGACVEVRQLDDVLDDVIEVRNSKNPTGPVVPFTVAEWDAFVGGVKDGEFDL